MGLEKNRNVHLEHIGTAWLDTKCVKSWLVVKFFRYRGYYCTNIWVGYHSFLFMTNEESESFSTVVEANGNVMLPVSDAI